MIATLHRIEANCGLRLARLARPNWRSPQAKGLAAWWPLSPCTGRVAPEVVGARVGNTVDLGFLPKELSWQADPAWGFVPQFDGSYEISFPDVRLPAGASPRTISLWLSFTEVPMAYIRGAFSYGDTSNGHAVIIGIGNIPAWQPAGGLGVSVWDRHLVASRAYLDGAWHQVAAVLDDLGWSLYVDGRLENSKSLAEMPTNTWQTGFGNIGAYNYGSYTHFWRGPVRDVRIYERALSAAEIWTLYDPATRFDLWTARRSWLIEPPPPPPFLRPQAQVYVTGQESGQCQHPGAMAGEVR